MIVVCKLYVCSSDQGRTVMPTVKSRIKLLNNQSIIHNWPRSYNDIHNLLCSNQLPSIYACVNYIVSYFLHSPLVIKFLQAADAMYLLSNKSKLKSQVFLKPDLTPEVRAKESLLLKERWSLIQKALSTN